MWSWCTGISCWLLLATVGNAAPLELVLQAGHNKDIKTLSLSADGKLLASGAEDGAAILWETATGRVLRRFMDHKAKVTSVSLSADGQTLATGSDDRTVILWSTATGEKLHTLKKGFSLVTAVAISPDGKQLACASWDKDVVIYDVAKGELTKTLKGHTTRVEGVAWSDDGLLLLTGSGDKTAILWDVAKEEGVRTCSHSGSVKSVAFNANSKQFLTTSGKTLTLWDRNQDKPVRTLTSDFGDFYDARFTDDRKYILGVGYDHNFYVWDATTGERPYPKIEANSGSGGYAVLSSPDSKTFYVATRLDGIHVYETATGKLLRTLKGQGAELRELALSADGKRLALGFNKPVAVVWDMAKGQPWHTFRGLDERGGMATMALRPDGERLVVMCTQYALAISDVTKKEKITGVQHRNMPFQIAFRADGKQFTVTNAHSVTVCEGDKAAIVQGLASSGDIISAACLSPDGSLLLTGETRAGCQLWDVKTNKKVFDLRGHSNSVARAVFRPDGKQAATGSVDGKVVLWDVTTGQQVRTFEGRGYVGRLEFSADGKFILLGTGNVALLYNVEKGDLVQTFSGHLGAVMGVGFSPDGQRIATASADGTARIWDTTTGKELAAMLCVDQGKEWAVVAPDGTYDGSPTGLQALTFREVGTVKLTAPTKEQHKPGLLAEIWGGKK